MTVPDTAVRGRKTDGQQPDVPSYDRRPPLTIPLPPLRGYQREAVEAIVEGAAREGRGQVIAACGTGKTLIAAHAAVRCCPRGVVVIVCPSLALIGQTLRVWRPLGAHTAAVCSDASVAEVAGHSDPMTCPVLADTDEVTAWLHRAPPGRMRLLAVTNSSADRVGAALLAAGVTADLLIIDEAHRTAGHAGKAFARVHDDSRLPARVRVNMTATPRIITARDRPGQSSEALSMDDPAVFGPVWHRYPFGQAITDGWLDDFRIVVVGVGTHDALRVLQDTDDDRITAIGEAPLRTAVVQTALLRAATEFALRRVLVFTPRVADSREFARTLGQTAARLPAAQQPKGRLTTGHVDGQQNLRQRQIHLDHLAEPPDDGWTVISSARALTEGIDVPAVDAVVLTRPMRSTVQVVQTVGRALRRNPRGSGIATILVPLLLPDDPTRLPDADDEWMTALQVLWAMRAHDDTLAADLDTRHHHRTTSSRQPQLPERVLLRMPDGYLTDTLLRDVTIRILDHATTGRPPTPPTENWTAGLAAVRAYRHREGHLDVPRYHREGKIDIGTFIHNCRGRYRRGELTPHQILALEECGITWRVFDARWQRHLTAFTTYRHREGHLRIPRHHREGDINLGSIAHNLRNQRQRNLVPPDRIDALDALGFPWARTKNQQPHP
ncbi:DEAD/DEAH box helicase [Micromonospora rifamycinica]|uniref:Helicase conserved C-terminal domain-containing protein n=1 Tax=Micromonospora rifamycinica TaxID=291594 RepID=A0A1C5KFQ5_9ACTN|nr:DEAD/DEAH box helicase [Micromonospora rifamycinica]SCG81590.1 Helicase conserved C-terminal domain-containing protein [Micromonospora rifamycinica]